MFFIRRRIFRWQIQHFVSNVSDLTWSYRQQNDSDQLMQVQFACRLNFLFSVPTADQGTDVQVSSTDTRKVVLPTNSVITGKLLSMEMQILHLVQTQQWFY